MTDNMTDITLKREKIKDLREKYLKYRLLLDEWPKPVVDVQEVRHWLKDLVSPLLPELTANGLKLSAEVNGFSNNPQNNSDSETDFDANQTKAIIVDKDVSISDNINNSCDSPTDKSPETDSFCEIIREVNEEINSDFHFNTNCLDINSINSESDSRVGAEPKHIETGADNSDKDKEEAKDSNKGHRIDSIGSELSSEDSDNKSSDKSMSGSVRTRLRPKCDNKESHDSSNSSEIEFDDSSDTPESGSDSDSDFDINGKSSNSRNSCLQSKYERLKQDFRLKYKPIVEVINLNEDIIDSAINDTSSAFNTINKLETDLFDSLRSKGVVCRKMKSIKQKESKDKNNIKEEDSDSDKELKRLCRIPKISKNGSKRAKNGNDSNDSNNSESSESERKHKNKKLKTSTPLSKNKKIKDSDSELESDLEISKIKKSSEINSNDIKSDRKIDALDSDLTSDEDIPKKESKSPKKTKKEKKSNSDVDDNDSDSDTKDIKKDFKLSSNRESRAVKKEEDKNEDKTVIDIDSDEDIVIKKKSRKGRVSDDDDYKEDQDSDDSSVLESSDGMDPSANDSDEDSDSEGDSKSKKKKKKSKKSDSKNKKGKRRRVKVHNSSDDDECQVLSDENDSPNKSRKNIRKIISDKKIKQQTKDAAEAERDRVRRIKEKQKEYNDLIKTRSLKSADVKELILEFDKETKEPKVAVDETLVKFLKPHQKNGIEFMYNCAIETVEQLTSGNEGSGCILAHSMGLGKTLQVITFLYTILMNKEINKHIKRALVICPVNTIKNWANEFRVWLNDNDLDDLLVFEMFDAKTPGQRAELLNIWHKRGGVMIIGLTLFSSLVMGGRGKKPAKFVRDAIQKCLIDPGAEIVVCDEGHLLKNEKTAYNRAVSQIKSLRRIVLTGTPLQNNLKEYHVMVHFVKPNLLGTQKEFQNRFVNPITNGQHEDSTDYDVKIMKKRVHILHTLLNGCVHRCDYNVLVPYLQPKHEYVLSVTLTEKQIELYSHYLQNISDRQKMSLLADYGSLRLIWNHPILLYEQHRRRIEKANEAEDSLEEFIDDEDDAETPPSGDSDIECIDDGPGPSKPLPKRRMRTRFGNKEEEEEEKVAEPPPQTDDDMSDAWFYSLLKKDDANQIELSGKFILLFAILEECEKLGDKILVFSQSLDTLDLVEEMLELRMRKAAEETRNIPEIDLESGHSSDATNVWIKNKDYFRLDGSTASDYRKTWTDVFNDENNYRARLFLISTKAGGLGINLVGANRCIIFDASWNPTHDVQAIFRIFRFGQKKPVYVYRFVANGTMEEKIYERQIIKQSLSCRVVDEQSIGRHFKAGEMSELYVFKPGKKEDRPTPNVPKDRLLAEMLKSHKDFIYKYHEHDSLLENRPDEQMSEEEKQAAWNEYEQEKDALFTREQAERDLQMQREYWAQQQQFQQQNQQQALHLQQQQYLQQMIQQMQSNGQFQGNPTDAYQSILNYQNVMRQQAELRKRQQQLYNEARQQRLAELARMAGVSNDGPPSNSSILPSYDKMTVEDIGKYLKNMNNNIEPIQVVQRIFAILETGLNTCTKELNMVKLQIQSNKTPEVMAKYEKLAKEVFNLNRQKIRAQTMFTKNGTSDVRQNANPQKSPNDDDMEPSTSSAKKTADELIEEID